MEEASTISKAIENAWNRAGQPQEFTVKILEHPKTTFFGLKTEKSAKIAFFFNEVPHKAKDHIAARPMQQKSHQKPHDNRRPQQDGQVRTEGRHEHQRRHEPREQRHDAPRNENRHEMREQRPEQDRHDTAPRHRQGYAGQAGQEPSISSEVDRSARTENRPERRPEFKERRHDDRREGNRRHEDRREDRRHDNRRDNRDGSAPRYNSDESRDTWTPDMVQNVQEWVKETLVLMGKPDINVTPHVSHNYLKLSLDNQVNDDARQEETQLKSWSSLAMESLREKTNKPLRGLRIVLESKK